MSAYSVRRVVVSASPGAAADTLVATPAAGKRIVVKAFWAVVAAAASHARFRSAANEIFSGGGAAAGIPFGANGGVAIGWAGDDPSSFWFQCNVGEVLNFRTEIATELTVGVIYEER